MEHDTHQMHQMDDQGRHPGIWMEEQRERMQMWMDEQSQVADEKRQRMETWMYELIQLSKIWMNELRQSESLLLKL
jgi:hypothetical protein